MSARPRRLVELCSELFSFAYSLRVTHDLGDPIGVRQEVMRVLAKMQADGKNLGYSSQDLDNARFALVALIDEAVLLSQWVGKNEWRGNTLQRELYKINTAGEEFFVRLERMRESVKEFKPVLEVYYASLVMGFEGRYKLLGREKCEALIEELARQISGGSRWKLEDLSPDWRRPDDFPEVVGGGIPVWASLLGVVVVFALLILIFRWVALYEAGQVAENIQRSLRELIG